MADSPHLQRTSTIGTPAGQAARPRRIATARRLAAEVIGTFWLVLGGCGAAVLAAGTGVPGTIGMAGVALAFGLGGRDAAGNAVKRMLDGAKSTDDHANPAIDGNFARQDDRGDVRDPTDRPLI